MTALEPVVATNPSHLRSLIREATNKNGFRCSLNHIDVSQIQSMDSMFHGSPFDGDISLWNTRRVVSMVGLFAQSHFNGDITRWNVSNVENMSSMFTGSRFNKSIANWNVEKVTNFMSTFGESRFSRDLSAWRVSPDAQVDRMVSPTFKGLLPSQLTAAQFYDISPYEPLDAHFDRSKTFTPGMTWWLHLARAKSIPVVVPATLKPWLEQARALGSTLEMPHADVAMYMSLLYPMRAVEKAQFEDLVRREYVVQGAMLDIMKPEYSEDDSWDHGTTAFARRRFQAIVGAQKAELVPPETYELPSLVR